MYKVTKLSPNWQKNEPNYFLFNPFNQFSCHIETDEVFLHKGYIDYTDPLNVSVAHI